ncbi:MAG: hypothetical protein LBV49_07485, partial [Azonexus sp.]|nr:hypothetical protein [Azonexus sp.]
MPEKLTPSDRRTTAAEYLDRAKTAMGVASDYALAKRLEVDAALIAHLRRGRRTMPLILAVKIAITLEADPLAVIAEMQLER